MYINFHKYNYDIVPDNQREEYENRDKAAYKDVLKDWFDSNTDQFINRKWEIKEIHYLKEIGDFIKLIREAESLYELGFFTGCIALVGVSAEDYTKYISLTHNRMTDITDTSKSRKYADVSQRDRLKLQLNEGVINKITFDLLDDIRNIRNDCLHYNKDFKQKSDDELKADALEALNSLKTVLKDNIGATINPNDTLDLLNDIYLKENHRSFQEMVWKQRNMMSHVLKIPLAFDPSIKKTERMAVFRVDGLDDDEITLIQVMPPARPMRLVWVDIDNKGKDLITKNQIEPGNHVIAKIYSNIAKNGTPQIWFLNDIEKISL